MRKRSVVEVINGELKNSYQVESNPNIICLQGLQQIEYQVITAYNFLSKKSSIEFSAIKGRQLVIF